MYLQEEYLQRHGIEGVPVVNHITSGCLLLQNPLGGWTLMAITWKDPRNHPGKYYINYYNPIHDAFKKGGRYFTKCLDRDIEVEWDRFQDYLLGWSRGVEARAVEGDTEVFLASWEAFTYCIDEWLATEADGTFRKLHFASIDLDRSISERYASYQTALAYLGTHFPYMFKVFREDFKVYLRNYCHWLARLVNGNIS